MKVPNNALKPDGTTYSKSVVYQPDEVVEDIPLDYPDLVESVADWWYDLLVDELNKELRVARMPANNRVDYYLENSMPG